MKLKGREKKEAFALPFGGIWNPYDKNLGINKKSAVNYWLLSAVALGALMFTFGISAIGFGFFGWANLANGLCSGLIRLLLRVGRLEIRLFFLDVATQLFDVIFHKRIDGLAGLNCALLFQRIKFALFNLKGILCTLHFHSLYSYQGRFWRTMRFRLPLDLDCYVLPCTLLLGLGCWACRRSGGTVLLRLWLRCSNERRRKEERYAEQKTFIYHKTLTIVGAGSSLPLSLYNEHGF